MGRIGLATQGVMYLLVGLLALRVALGDEVSADQRGALQVVARQPLGQFLLGALAVGLVAHALWRAMLAWRGEPGGGDDGRSVAKRAANAGRALIYAALAAAAVTILTRSRSGGGGSGSTEETSTAVALALPFGEWLVLAVAAGLAGGAIWNAKRAWTRSFLDALECGSLDRRQQRAVEVVGVVGYAARAAIYLAIASFLFAAARQRDPSEATGLDGALHRLRESPPGPALLVAVAVGLILFGAYRLVDARLRAPQKLTHS